jgi:membrane fusion protein, multidrug efflux system
MNNKKTIIISTIFAAIAIAIPIWYQVDKNKQSDQKIVTAKAVKTDLKIAFSIDGSLEVDRYEPSFSIAGKVSQVLVKEGDTIKKGQWLATLDAQDAQKNLEKTLKDYSIERNDFSELSQVTYADSVVTDTVKRILEKNQWNLDKAVLDVELKDLAIKQSRVISPIEGVVAQINIKQGDVVSTQNQTPIATIIKPDSLSFIAFAEEDDALRITSDQKITLVLDAYKNEIFPAKLTFLSPISQTDTNGLSSYKVSIEIENPNNLKIMDGMEGSASFVAKEVKNVISIPNKAVYREGSQSYLDIIDINKNITKTPIQTGFTDGKNVEVKEGLAVGQEVILKN